MHYEYMGVPASPHIDCLQFRVASSLKKAEVFIRGVHVDAYSWWQIHPHIIDADRKDWLDEGETHFFYSHRGTPLKAAPFKRARTAWLKHVKANAEFYPPPP